MEEKVMKLSVTRQSIARCLKIILGNFLITGAYAFITVPNEIVNGGVTSFSMILGNLLSIDLTYLVDFFTILLLILCYIFLGKKFFTGTVFSCFCYLILFSVLHGLGYAILVHPLIGMVLAGIGFTALQSLTLNCLLKRKE